MEEVVYIGESLWQGMTGHLLVIVAFVAALFGAASYLLNTKESNKGLVNTGRVFFSIHALSVFGIIALLLAMMIGQRFEYAYVWEHVSEDLPLRYIFSAFWEGQEGSFLLWMFWHAVLGVVLMRTAGKWESPVLGTLLLVQIFIASMLLGIHFTDEIKIGVDPFALLRDTMQAPIFARADYLTLVEGNGLNPLLQNYWMTIHPPTLFLGFASVTIPFCFAMSGLITGDHKGWLRSAMPWALFSAGILGTGILMGGAWAYEALSFGGYWAWDPVENMSLVPWIILVAGVHGHLIAQRTGESIRTTYGFYIGAFLLILYSTFLTRSGVLGDSSAHAFTQMGLEWQLVLFIAFFAIWSIVQLIRKWKSVPQEAEASMASRSFWMVIGTLVLLFSSILIAFTTSIPVWNKILDLTARILDTDYSYLHRTAPIDPIEHYNKFQLWIGVFVALLSATAQFLRYRESNWNAYRTEFFKNMAVSGLIAAVMTVLLSMWINVYAWQYWVLLACASFAISANLIYLIPVTRLNPRLAASGLAHLGFGVMLVGIMSSGLNKAVISTNTFAQMGLIEGLDAGRYITLIKDRPMFMNNYWVEYTSDTITGNMREFTVEYKRVNEQQDTIERFTLHPNVVFDNKQTKVAATNPSTKHYLWQDIFTYVAALPGEQMDVEEARKINDTRNYKQATLNWRDTLLGDGYQVWLKQLTNRTDHPDYESEPGDLAIQASIGIKDERRGRVFDREVLVYLRDGLVYGFPAQVNDLNMRVRMSDEAIRGFFVADESLEYTDFEMKAGEETQVGDVTVLMNGVDKAGTDPQYSPQNGDIAINAAVTITKDGKSIVAKPLYYIRGNRPQHVKAFTPELGTHIKFVNIDPATETFYFQMAQDNVVRDRVDVDIANNVPRNDIIVIEAIVFPGINLFWSGAVLMMVGLFWAMFYKRKEAKVTA